ncbi:MAG TPA: YggS family pyridoxal phosphate-dependent enzyme [Candidatus Dormibacteraeota bacterium]|nr:YggS family pyridoxal phosphate-dependent enzyme [Candidatus Dormibacteraeota bacterium]
MNTAPTLAENLARVRERIDAAAARAGRLGDEITLVAISKTHPAERIRELHEAGVRHFGENRVQEWESKRARLPDLDAVWHMIGHVQSNKAARVVRLFDSVDSVDSLALAERLNKAKESLPAEDMEREEKGKGGEDPRQRLRVLIEVKLDPEPAKSGISEENVPRLVEALQPLPHLELRGLMGVPPYCDDPEQVRPYFQRLRELRDAVRAQMGRESLPVLSMGMSHDFEVAIEEGATEVRVGSGLFGERRKA